MLWLSGRDVNKCVRSHGIRCNLTNWVKSAAGQIRLIDCAWAISAMRTTTSSLDQFSGIRQEPFPDPAVRDTLV